MITQLFDKFINLRFYGVSDSYINPDMQILTPSTGMKPELAIQGTFVPGTGVPGLSIRVTNMASAFPIWEYANHKLEVEVGYFSDKSLTAKFDGMILTAGEEKTGPDSITTFTLLLGNYQDYNNKFTKMNFLASNTVGDVLNKILSDLSNKYFKYAPFSDTVSNTLATPLKGNGFQYNGPIKGALDMLHQLYDLDIVLQGNSCRIIKHGYAFTNNIFDLQYISTVTRRAESYTIKAPWIPKLLPDDIVRFSPSTAKQTIGGQFDKPTIMQKVVTVDFDFSTTGHTNDMTLMTLNAG